ncbi:NADH-quinone oxidoreductase subunit 12 [Planctomycetes bacterium Poly30]|uniref:Probable inorganic carbon transporter subunit DabB n=1 Tax=Saltatorellus ferox TaxID=2528018 RepID=A0A518EVK2_9BACT|nr:NADH-quinone oxidoreductase subunit 12 [Planctomycetes bacterium Poly30]
MISPLETGTSLAGAALAVPCLFLGSALLASRRHPFSAARAATGAAAIVTLVGLAVGAFAPVGTLPDAALGVRLDLVTAAMLLLVALIAFVIVRYSVTYLHGDPGQLRYSRWLMVTLAAVSVLVGTDHLGVLAAAWTATSLALHQLLTFFQDRPAAQVAAHKKFLVSRLADACLWSGLALLHSGTGTLSLTELQVWAANLDGTGTALPHSTQAAAFLFAIAACLKSAQLPFHGWLTQVMEAPTPVSALLHAGVVNIGGFLMIRLAMVMGAVPSAQLLLVFVGTATAVLAALVMTTRVSVKVGLAWSTCAQMGLMLAQCGLGAWHLALLHLLAHSFYKAHAFLSSGSTVEIWRAQSLLEKAPATRPGQFAQATAISLAAVASVSLAVHALGGGGFGLDLAGSVLTLVAALAFVPAIAGGLAEGTSALSKVMLQVGLLVGLYFGWHAIASDALPWTARATAEDPAWLLFGGGFVALFIVQSILRVAPSGALARRLHPSLFAGFYLDELFTRMTFRVWPPRLEKTEPPAALPSA